MIAGSEVVTANPKQILNQTVHRKETLGLSHRLELPHLAHPLSSVLVRDLRPVVLILTGLMGNGWEDFSMRRRIAPEPVGDELPGRLLLMLQGLTKETFGGSPVPPLGD